MERSIDTLAEFLARTPELRHLGMNSETLLSLVILGFAAYQATGTWGQVRLIFKNRSVEGVSIPTMTFFGFYFIAFMIYGIVNNMLCATLAGLQFLLFGPLLFGAYRYGGTKTRMTIFVLSALFVFFPVLMYAAPWKEELFFILYIGILATTFHVFYKVWSAKSVRAVSSRWLFAFFANCVFWGLYGALVENAILLWFNAAMGIVLLFAYLIYLQKKRKEITA